MYRTEFFKDNKITPFIPAEIIISNAEMGTFKDGKYTFCVNWIGYEFEKGDYATEVIFKWSVLPVEGFVFFTRHELDSKLIDLLEGSRAIKRSDGLADLSIMENYEYDIVFRKYEKGYIVDKIEPQDDSYFLNIKAFYKDEKVLSDLQGIANDVYETNVKHEKHIFLEFSDPEYQTFSEFLSSIYFEGDRLSYESEKNTFSLKMTVDDAYQYGTTVAEATYVYFALYSTVNMYMFRIRVNDYFVNWLMRLRALKNHDGMLEINFDVLMGLEFVVELERIDNAFRYKSIQLWDAYEELFDELL